jgi:hypothetical protein
VLPELLTPFRSRLAEAWLKELLTLQAGAAIEDGVGSPAPVVVATFPRAQGSHRVKAAGTLDKAKTKASRSARSSRTSGPPRGPP